MAAGIDTENLYEDFLQSELLLYCVKKCLLRTEISPSLKLKILFLLYNKCKYVDSKDENLPNLDGSLMNPLGIDDDLIQRCPEPLTADQSKELRKLMLDELRKFHSFCYSLRAETKNSPDISNDSEQFGTLFLNLNKQMSALNEYLNVQKKIENVKSIAYLVLQEKYTELIAMAKYDLSEERKLFEEIVNALIRDGRGQSLQAAEEILERKINNNREKIDQMKFQLLEYHNIRL